VVGAIDKVTGHARCKTLFPVAGDAPYGAARAATDAVSNARSAIDPADQ